MSYTITDLRQDLADTIRALRDPNSPMDINRAKAVSEVAQTMINSAKVEVEMINALGRGRVSPSGFIWQPTRDTLDHQQGDKGVAVAGDDTKPEPEKRYIGAPRARAL